VCKQGSLITHVFIAKSRDKQKRVEKQPGQSFNSWMKTVDEKEYLGGRVSSCVRVEERETSGEDHRVLTPNLFLPLREGRQVDII
jgi:hypothetical protein